MIENKLDERVVKEINKKLLKTLNSYQAMMTYTSADIPIEVLCLPKTIQTILLRSGCLRVYDLLNRDLTEIKGLGKSRIGDLTARLNEFLSVG